MGRRSGNILWAGLLFLAGCGSPTGTTPPAGQTPLPSATPDAVLLHVQGEVRLQQVITGQVVPASFGDGLWRGDVIVTEQDAQAEVLCSDGQSIEVAPNQSVPVTCGETPDPVYQSVIVRIHGEQIEALPSTRPTPSDNDNLPVVLSPRNTHLADGRPAIRWRAVEGAEGYEVVVSGPGGELWRATAQGAELPYPEAQPPLGAEVGYLIQVTARMAQAEQPRPSEPVLVTVLSAAKVEQVSQFEAQIEGLGLSGESARFLRAAYYADQELYGEAIAALVSLAEETSAPLAHRLLGDVYLDVGLDDEAAQSYRQARELAQEQGNRPVQAETEVGLGHVAFAAGRFEEALSHYRTAQTLYQELGLASDAGAVAELASGAEARLPTPTP